MRRQACLLMIALLLAGCTLAPKYTRTPGKVPPEYRFQSLEGQPRPELNTLADLAWWKIFGDPEMQNLIRIALEQNYDVQLAAARVAEARARVGVSRSLWLPQAGGTSFFQRQRFSEKSFPPFPANLPPTGNIGQLNLDLFWEIDLFGRLRSLTQAARAEFLASEWAKRAVFASAVAEVAQAYFELRTLDEQLLISQATLKSFEKSRRLVVMRFERGVVSRQDVAQVDALVHTAGARIADLQRLIAQQKTKSACSWESTPNPSSGASPCLIWWCGARCRPVCPRPCWNGGRTFARPKSCCWPPISASARPGPSFSPASASPGSWAARASSWPTCSPGRPGSGASARG